MSFFKFSCLIIIVFSAILGLLFYRFGGSIFSGLLKPVSIVSKVIGNEDLKSTDGRTNILLLGLDQRSAQSTAGSTLLTDTIIIISIGENGTSTSMISIPRDLWVPEINEKINALYAWNSGPYAGRREDVTKVTKKLEDILGMPIHYHAVVGFTAFKEAVDAVDGVSIDVQETFEDNLYPVEGKENAMPESERYMTVKFSKGLQTMKGETALQYARSRHSSNYNEAGDFARARRQQKVIVSLKDKILSSDTLLNPGKISELYEVFKRNVKTDVALNDALLFYSKLSDIEINNIKKIVLSDETLSEDKPGSGLLSTPSQEDREALYGGKYVLIPNDSSYNEIQAMIRKTLFCSAEDESCKN